MNLNGSIREELFANADRDMAALHDAMLDEELDEHLVEAAGRLSIGSVMTCED